MYIIMNGYIQYIILWLVCITLTSVLSNEEVDQQKVCSNLNESCSRILFRRCCDKLVCQGFFTGTCVECLGINKLCFRSSDCCSGRCWFFHCKEQNSNITTSIENDTETQQNMTNETLTETL
ncbi:unnamed protein product [Schistosoma rodhaini]|nr:unnamed protein product [Schistosoma rodhaini]